MTAAAVPIVKWLGGKRAMLPQLLPMCPEWIRQHEWGQRRYYEPMLGGGAMFLALDPPRAVLGDANHELMDMYSVVRAFPHKVMATLDQLQPLAGDKQAFLAIRNADPAELDAVTRAARVLYLNRTCWNGLWRVNRAGQFNVPFRTSKSLRRLYDPTNLLGVADRLRQAELRAGDFSAVLHDVRPGDFVYLDAPYGVGDVQYTADGWTAEDEQRLVGTVKQLTRCGVQVMLSCADSPAARWQWREYNVTSVAALRRVQPQRRRADGGSADELVVRNYCSDEWQ